MALAEGCIQCDDWFNGQQVPQQLKALHAACSLPLLPHHEDLPKRGTHILQSTWECTTDSCKVSASPLSSDGSLIVFPHCLEVRKGCTFPFCRQDCRVQVLPDMPAHESCLTCLKQRSLAKLHVRSQRLISHLHHASASTMMYLTSAPI